MKMEGSEKKILVLNLMIEKRVKAEYFMKGMFSSSDNMKLFLTWLKEDGL